MSALQNEPRKVVKVTPAEVSAARLKLVTDRKLGRDTPTWVRRVANAKPETRTQR